MGVLCQSGLGVPLNYGEAYKWFSLAAQAGNAESNRALKDLAQIMTKNQFRDGETMVSEWVSHHAKPIMAAQKSEAELHGNVSAVQP
jgi:localization factor PodJL